MGQKRKPLFSNNKLENWKNLVLAGIVFYYFINFLASVGRGSVGDDYLAFWSVGKIADEKGYSQIYDLNDLRNVQSRELVNSGLLEETKISSFTTIPVPYFSFFIVPFQILSRFNLVLGDWIWGILNLVILIGYLLFLKKDLPRNASSGNYLSLLILILISYSVLSNITVGQVEVFLVVFTGEFIRHAVGKKPVMSGIWLGGLLLKPQLLILVVPILLIMRNWKVLYAFFVSSGIILMTSLFLSGLAGMQALINLWTKYSAGMDSNFVEGMINWRMLGVNMNTFTDTTQGWVITSLGMGLTIVAVYFLIRQHPPFGSPQWVVSMLGVFSATLAVTWHSHYHMAMVLIPFFIYASMYKQFPQNIIFLWGVVVPVALFVILIIDLFVYFVMKNIVVDHIQLVIAFSGFITNLLVLGSAVRFVNDRNLEQIQITK